jgi:hypothetical protein
MFPYPQDLERSEANEASSSQSMVQTFLPSYECPGALMPYRFSRVAPGEVPLDTVVPEKGSI